MSKNEVLKKAFEEAAKEEINSIESEKHEFPDEFEEKIGKGLTFECVE